MKKSKIGLYFILMMVLIVLIFSVYPLIFVPGIMSVGAEEKILGAHRGDSINHIENTIPSLKSAAEDPRYSFIEFDVRYTKDKVVVLHHDNSLLRLHGKLGEVSELTYPELLNLSDYHIPTYKEAIETVGGKKPLDIEIKSNGNLTEDLEIARYITEDLNKRGLLSQTMISSPSSDIIENLEKKTPNLKTGKVYWVTTSTMIRLDSFINEVCEESQRINTDYVILHASNIVNYEHLRENIPEGKKIMIWYFNDEVYIIDSDVDFYSRLAQINPFSRKKHVFKW